MILGGWLGPWWGSGCSDENWGHTCTPGGGGMDAQPFGCVLSPLLLLVLMPPAAHAAHLAASARGFSEPFPVTWEAIGVLQVSRHHRALASPGFEWRSRAGCSFPTPITLLLSALLPPAPQTPSAHKNPPVLGVRYVQLRKNNAPRCQVASRGVLVPCLRGCGASREGQSRAGVAVPPWCHRLRAVPWG